MNKLKAIFVSAFISLATAVAVLSIVHGSNQRGCGTVSSFGTARRARTAHQPADTYRIRPEPAEFLRVLDNLDLQ